MVKLKENDTFKNLANSMGENEFWQKFLETLRGDDYEKIMDIKNEHLKMGHNSYDIEERMNFINSLPIEYDIKFY